MNFKVRYILWKAQRGLSARRGFKGRLAERLGLRPARVLINCGLFTVPVRPILASALCLVVLAGASSYAYHSSAVLPGSNLYAIKTGLDKVASAWPRSPAAQAEVYFKQLERRDKELAALYQAQQARWQAARESMARVERDLRAVMSSAALADNVRLQASFASRMKMEREIAASGSIELAIPPVNFTPRGVNATLLQSR